MKKYVFLYYGYETPTQELEDAWNDWFASIETKIVDLGAPLGSGQEVTHAGTKELSLEEGAATGYTIIQADSMDEAIRIAQDCPIVTSVRVYEAMSM
jgi:hypothetical protein